MEDDDRVGVRRGDGLDELVLVARERERRAVEPLAVALPDDDDRRRGGARRGDRLLDEGVDGLGGDGGGVVAVSATPASRMGARRELDRLSRTWSGKPDDVTTFCRRVVPSTLSCVGLTEA